LGIRASQQRLRRSQTPSDSADTGCFEWTLFELISGIVNQIVHRTPAVPGCAFRRGDPIFEGFGDCSFHAMNPRSSLSRDGTGFYDFVEHFGFIVVPPRC
jgi:hypothetical protein